MRYRESRWHLPVHLFLFAEFVLLFVHRVAADDKTELPPLGRISAHGVVVNSSGEPQPGTRVLVRAASAPAFAGLIDFADVIGETTTDGKGRFAFDQVSVPPTMEYVVENLEGRQRGADVIALADGYGLSWTPLYSSKISQAITLRLHAKAALEGVVSSADDRPLTDAEVTVTGISRLDAPFDPIMNGPDELRLYASSIRPKTRTDLNGKFRIDGLPAECRIHLHVVHPDHSMQFLVAVTSDNIPTQPLSYRLGAKTHELVVQGSPVQVKLNHGPRLRVRVVDEEPGAPIPRGQIALLRQSSELHTNVGSNGAAAITVAEPGVYDVWYLPADRNEGFGMSQKVTMADEHVSVPRELVLRLPRRLVLEGRVVGKGTETGLVGVTVAWLPGRGSDAEISASFVARTVTRPDGHFRLPALPGRGRLSLDGDAVGFFIPSYDNVPYKEMDNYAIAVDVADNGSQEPIRIDVPRGLVIRGTVRDADGKALPRADIRAASNGQYGPRFRDTVSDDAGRFEIAGLNPRESYSLLIVRRDEIAFHTVPREESHPIEKAREVDVALVFQPAVTMRGRVLHGDEPLPDVRLVLLRGHRIDRDRVQYRPMADAMTGADGRYDLVGLRAGDLYHIEVHSSFPAVDPEWPHQSPYVQTLPEDAKGEVVLPDVKLFRMSQTLAGIVVDPAGKPVSGATVSAQLPNGGSLFRTPNGPQPSTETDKEGRFRLEQLPDQPLQLMAYIRPKGANRRIRFPAIVKSELNQQNVRIVLDPSLVEDD